MLTLADADDITIIKREIAVYFDIIGKITNIETIAVGNAIDELDRLQRQYGRGRWRKRKGIASVRLANGRIRVAEVHWYEAHGIGRKKFKIKDYLDED